MNRKEIAGVLLSVGCADENAELADYAMESARWQAEQSQTLVEANQNIADGSRGLVTADAASRQELAIVNHIVPCIPSRSSGDSSATCERPGMG